MECFGSSQHQVQALIRLSVLYPKGDGITFDVDYYKTTHMGIVDNTMKPTRWESTSELLAARP